MKSNVDTRFDQSADICIGTGGHSADSRKSTPDSDRMINRNNVGFKTVGAVAAVFLISACASALTSYREMTPEPMITGKAPVMPFNLGLVSLGYTARNPTAGEFVRLALETTLRESGVFDLDGRDVLNVELLGLVVDTDYLGLNMTAKAVGLYRVSSISGRSIFEKSFSSAGVATVSDELIGAERMELATRRAIKANLATFRDSFRNHVAVNIAKIRSILRKFRQKAPRPTKSKPPRSKDRKA